MPNLWLEFLAVAVAHFLAVASPGPDFAIVLRQSLSFGRRTAVWTAIGIGTGILLHVTYSLFGLGLLIRSSPLCFNILKYAGAAYIAWLGIQALRAKPPATTEASNTPASAGAPGAGAAFLTGFLTNALNPKVTLFFISLFVIIVNPLTPKWVQAGYGLWMSLATMAWFSLVAVVFTREGVRRRFLRSGPWIDRVLGVVFLAFAAGLVLSSLT
ncbi:MAG: rhtC [Verrucomicrobia bacterium]|nr:rhtC [Verrucomicrobiota bacterium]